MMRWCIALLSILLPLVIYAQVAQIEFVDRPDAVSEYVEEYSLATALIDYLWQTQYEKHCRFDWLVLEYSEEYVSVCVFDNVHDGSSYLFAEIGGEGFVDTKEVLVMRDGQVIRHNARWGRNANEPLAILIPQMESMPGEYIVFATINRDGEMAHKSARFIIEPMGALEE